MLSRGYFFNLQSLTTSKMRQIQTIKLSQFQKEKNLLDWKLVVLWDYEQLLRGVFLCFRWQKKNLNFFKKYFSNRIERLHNNSFIKKKFLTTKSWKKLKNWNCHHKIFVTDHFPVSSLATQAIKIKFNPVKNSSSSNLILQTWFFKNQVQTYRGFDLLHKNHRVEWKLFLRK